MVVDEIFFGLVLEVNFNRVLSFVQVGFENDNVIIFNLKVETGLSVYFDVFDFLLHFCVFVHGGRA